jgi:hypothetical protein
MNPNPGQSSGNGNPAILVMAILLPLFCYMVFLWFRIIYSRSIRPAFFLVTMMLIIFHWIIAFFYQRKAFYEYREVLADAYKQRFGFVEWEYIDQISSLLSIHVNNQYFNINTYFMFLSLSVFIVLLIAFVMKLLKRNSSKNIVSQ